MSAEIFLPSTYASYVPYEMFRRLRDTAPVCWIEEPAVGPWPAGPGYWAVFRHADVKYVLRSPELFSSNLGGTQIRDPDTPEDLEFARAMMLNQDPPGHSRLRRIVAAAFTPRAVRALEATIEDRARNLIDAAVRRGEVDFVEVAADLPVWTLAHVMGVPEKDRRLLYDWASQAGTGTADNVMSRMLAGGLTEPEFENMFFLFAVAGNETLRNGIQGGLLTMMEHPDQFALLRADPSMLDSAVEEMMRFWPPVMDFRRTATRDVTLDGHHIGAGQKVVVYHASANRDERVFPDPDRFDITRSPNDHVSFGFGPHFCLGAHLARVQMRAIFRELLDLDVERTGDPVRLTSNFQNGLKHLPVRLRHRNANHQVISVPLGVPGR